MPAGRPRVESLSPEENIALGEEMLAWLESHPETLHLSEWYTIEKMIIYKDWKNLIVKIEFFPYYEKALKIVGKQYLDKRSNVREGISQRWQRVYFKDLKDQEDEDMKLKIDLEKNALEEKVSVYEGKYQTMISQLESLQKKNSDVEIKITD